MASSPILMPSSAGAGDTTTVPPAPPHEPWTVECHVYHMASSSYQLNDVLFAENDLLGMWGVDVLAKLNSDGAKMVSDTSVADGQAECEVEDKNDAGVMKVTNESTVNNSECSTSFQNNTQNAQCAHHPVLMSVHPERVADINDANEILATPQALADCEPEPHAKRSRKRKRSSRSKRKVPLSCEATSASGEEKESIHTQLPLPEDLCHLSAADNETPESPLKKAKHEDLLETKTPSARERNNLRHKAHRRRKRRMATLASNLKEQAPAIYKSATILVSRLLEDGIMSVGRLSTEPQEDGEVVEENVGPAEIPLLDTYRAFLDEYCESIVREKVKTEGFAYVPNVHGKNQFIFDQSHHALLVKKGQAPLRSKSSLCSEGAVHGILSKICAQYSDVLLTCGSNPSRENDGSTKETRVNPDTLKRSHGCISLSMGQTIDPEALSLSGMITPTSINLTALERPFVDKILKNKDVEGYLCSLIQYFRATLPRYAFLQLEVLKHLNVERNKQHDMFMHSLFPRTSVIVCSQKCVIGQNASPNVVGGMRMIAVLGEFNHKTSSHLTFEEAKVVMEVRPGDVFFVPSAGITVTLSSLQPGETRSVITQDVDIELFREFWRTCETLPEETKTQLKEIVNAGRNLMPTFEELVEATESGHLNLV